MTLLRTLRLWPLLLLFAGFGSGCTSLDRKISTGRDPSALREIFVASNLNDNHRLDQRIAAALRARGLRAEAGPITLLPPGAEAVLHYQDRWAWDFGEHMIYLELSLRDRTEVRPYATAIRSRHIARSTDLDTAIPELVATLLAPPAR